MKQIITLLKVVYYFFFPKEDRVLGIIRRDIVAEETENVIMPVDFSGSGIVTTDLLQRKVQYAHITILDGGRKTVKAMVGSDLICKLGSLKKGVKVVIKRFTYGEDNTADKEYEICSLA